MGGANSDWSSPQQKRGDVLGALSWKDFGLMERGALFKTTTFSGEKIFKKQ